MILGIFNNKIENQIVMLPILLFSHKKENENHRSRSYSGMEQ